MIISQQIVWNVKCDKCGNKWTTKDYELPANCSKCRSLRWNADSPPPNLTPEPIEQPMAAKPIVTAPAGMNDAMAKFWANVQPAVTEPVEDDWRFNNEKPQFNDQDGNVYRKQVLYPAGKRVRTVQVDEDDHERIIRVMK